MLYALTYKSITFDRFTLDIIASVRVRLQSNSFDAAYHSLIFIRLLSELSIGVVQSIILVFISFFQCKIQLLLFLA